MIGALKSCNSRTWESDILACTGTCTHMNIYINTNLHYWTSQKVNMNCNFDEMGREKTWKRRYKIIDFWKLFTFCHYKQKWSLLYCKMWKSCFTGLNELFFTIYFTPQMQFPLLPLLLAPPYHLSSSFPIHSSVSLQKIAVLPWISI